MSPDAQAILASPILATAVVPWTERYEFDEGRFCQQVRIIATGLTKAIYVFGTAGEGYAVTDRQYDVICRAFSRVSREAGVAPMVGLISLSLGTMVERIERARALGFTNFQISLPSWGALNDAELARFFAETCGRFPDCAFHHYNLLRVKRRLTGADYARLAADHPNFVAVKASSDDAALLADWLTVSPRLRFFFTEFGYAIARRTHDAGLLISVASANYARARAFVSSDDTRREADVVELQAIVKALLAAAAERFHMDGGYDKMLFRLIDPDFPLRLLPPYESATLEEFERFRAALPSGWRR
ncbi:MAG: dihydrodipicolinate synthase family protein [Opitutaceae bacterium]|nr:dihydrodipicolinate synthase family protein [Opitutaceae bacterium]